MAGFLENSVSRKNKLLKIREQLLDRPGIARTGGPPPPTVPAQDRTSPQEDAVAKLHPPEGAPTDTSVEVPANSAAVPEEEGLDLDEDTREELLETIRPVVEQMRVDKRAKLNQDLGRVRRFFGGGI